MHTQNPSKPYQQAGFDIAMTDFYNKSAQSEVFNRDGLCLTIPVLVFKELLAGLVASPSLEAWLTLGICHSPSHQEWLGSDLQFQQPGLQPTTQFPVLRVNLLDDTKATTTMNKIPAGFIGVLFCHHTELYSGICGFIKVKGKPTSLQYLNLAGSGFHILPLLDEKKMQTQNSQIYDSSNGRWSRTIGVLGLSTWQRLTTPFIAVIGCGRTGSMIANSLVRLGVQKIKLIDPDYIDQHNLGEMDLVTEEDIHRPKVEALLSHLKLLARNPNGLHCIKKSIAETTGQELIKTCDVLFSCVDNDSARLSVATVAALYHRVLIDIGTGIYKNPNDLASSGVDSYHNMGADIRLIVPGDGCLLCWGNLTDYRQAKALLGSNRLSPLLSWQNHRMGSLHSLNQMTSGIALQLYQDLAAERIKGSIWVQISFDKNGKMEVNYQERSLINDCPLCRQTGIGARY